MAQKTDKLNIRLAPEVKEALRAIAEREHRTISNMIEALILEKSKKLGIPVKRQGEKSQGPRRRNDD